MALEWQPTINAPFREISPIDWAQSVLDANPDTPVILSTHEYVDDSPAGRSGAGDALWDQLVRTNDQIFMVLNGHFHSVGGTNDGEYHQVSMNAADRPVFEVLQDFQDYPNGGDGWLRLIEFDPTNDTIGFETFSPVLNQFQTETVAQVGGFASQFEFNVDFSDRFTPVFIAPEPEPAGPDLFFQEGFNGYTGTFDKELRSSGGDSANGQNDSISIDGDDGSPGLQPNHGLIRFENLIGDGAGQLPAGAVIESAKLVVQVTSQGSGFSVHDLLVNWDEGSTWNGFGNGVQPNGVEAVSQPVVTLGADNGNADVSTGELEIDVTSSVNAYLDGSLVNRGWALLPFTNGTDGIDFFTSEFADVSARPALEITLTPGDYNLDGSVDQTDLEAWASEYGVTGFSFADGNKDGVVDAADYALLRDLLDAAGASTVSTPEPGAATLVLLSGTALAARRGRRAAV